MASALETIAAQEGQELIFRKQVLYGGHHAGHSVHRRSRKKRPEALVSQVTPISQMENLRLLEVKSLAWVIQQDF